MSRILTIMAVLCSALWLQGCATSNFYDKWTLPLMQGDAAKIQSYIDDGDHLTDQAEHGFTPLHLAAHSADASIVKIMLDGGADVDARAVNKSPLLWAVSSQHYDRTDVINLLLGYGADINARDLAGRTPVQVAMYNANNVRALLSAGANPIQAVSPYVSLRAFYKAKAEQNKKIGRPQPEILKSIAVLDDFHPPYRSFSRCGSLSQYQQLECYKAHLVKYPSSITTQEAKDNIANLGILIAQANKESRERTRLERVREIKIAKAKAAKSSMQKRIAQQACRLKSNGWLYLSKSCKKGLAHGQGEAINEEKALKFVGIFNGGYRTQGELYLNDQLMYDGSIKNGRPHGVGTCIHEGEPEECKFYKGKRTDVLYKQRLEFAKQRELMAKSEARINQSLESSEQRMNERLSNIELQSAAGSQAHQGSTVGDYAADALKKKAADKVADAIFDSLF